jgi:hypothetical protein
VVTLSLVLLAWTTSTALQAPPAATIFSDYFRIDGDVLTVDSVRSQSRPDGTLASMENTRVIIRYRRVR